VLGMIPGPRRRGELVARRSTAMKHPQLRLQEDREDGSTVYISPSSSVSRGSRFRRGRERSRPRGRGRTAVAGGAHEVSQPLAAVIMNTGTAARLLNAEPPDLEEARKLLASIARDAWRASDMIGNIRALAKKYPVLMERFEINDAIREALALTQGEIVRNRVELKTKLADPGPAIQGDRVQLQQVILNLILNAIEAMGHCEPRELSIETGKDVRGSLIVSVSDSGRGLDCAERNRLFQSFYSTKPGGTGMGLAVCRLIVESHEGKIWAASNEGPGATFAFTLPLAE